MIERDSSLPTTIRANVRRLAVACALYAAGGVALLGAYTASMVLLGWLANDAWGVGGATATVAACLALTATIAFYGAHRIVRSHRRTTEQADGTRSPATTGEIPHSAAPCQTGPAQRPAWEKILEGFVGLRLAPESWTAIASILAATLVIAGPVRLVRLGLRCYVVARTLRSIFGAVQHERVP